MVTFGARILHRLILWFRAPSPTLNIFSAKSIGILSKWFQLDLVQSPNIMKQTSCLQLSVLQYLKKSMDAPPHLPHCQLFFGERPHRFLCNHHHLRPNNKMQVGLKQQSYQVVVNRLIAINAPRHFVVLKNCSGTWSRLITRLFSSAGIAKPRSRRVVVYGITR